jgi:hypothetical protein
VVFTLASTVSADGSLVFVADGDSNAAGTIRGCDEERNVHDSGFLLNRPLSVDAGLDHATSMPEATVELRGTVEDDDLPRGTELQVRWFCVAAPVDLPLLGSIFADPTSLTTTASFPMAGTYVLWLRRTTRGCPGMTW